MKMFRNCKIHNSGTFNVLFLATIFRFSLNVFIVKLFRSGSVKMEPIFSLGILNDEVLFVARLGEPLQLDYL